MKIIVGGITRPFPKSYSTLDAFKEYYNIKSSSINKDKFLTDAREQLNKTNYTELYLFIYINNISKVEKLVDKLIRDYQSKITAFKGLFIKYTFDVDIFLSIAVNHLNDDEHKKLTLFVSKD